MTFGGVLLMDQGFTDAMHLGKVLTEPTAGRTTRLRRRSMPP